MYLKEKYIKEVLPELMKKNWYKNVMQAPKIEKIVLNMWIWTYIKQGNKDFEPLKSALNLISGQSSIVRTAKKSISNFKLREGMPVGLTVTLRWDKMYNFLEKMINVVLPRVRDFRWLPKKSFDREGNYNFWIKEHTIFPEVPQNDVIKTHGLQITISTKNTTKDSWRDLLELLGIPFAK